jgi:hypothetical protein
MNRVYNNTAYNLMNRAYNNTAYNLMNRVYNAIVTYRFS